MFQVPLKKKYASFMKMVQIQLVCGYFFGRADTCAPLKHLNPYAAFNIVSGNHT